MAANKTKKQIEIENIGLAQDRSICVVLPVMAFSGYDSTWYGAATNKSGHPRGLLKDRPWKWIDYSVWTYSQRQLAAVSCKLSEASRSAAFNCENVCIGSGQTSRTHMNFDKFWQIGIWSFEVDRFFAKNISVSIVVEIFFGEEWDGIITDSS